MINRRLTALALSLMFASAPMIAVPAAHAASATQNAYDDDTDVVPEEDNNDDTGVSPDNETAQPAPTPAATSNLPFTGLEAGLIAAAGLGLVGTGFVLRRAAREQV